MRPRIARTRSSSCSPQCDLLIVVGSRASSNSNRLRELADRAGIPGYLVDGADDLQREWIAGKQAIGVTAGASAPELLVQQVIERLRSWGGELPAELAGTEEHVIFGLPRALRGGKRTVMTGPAMIRRGCRILCPTPVRAALSTLKAL